MPAANPLVFLDQGVQINQEVYSRDILEAVVLSWTKQHFGDADWAFQQDFAAAHKAKTTQDWCLTHFPNFISSLECPHYSPDLNPMDLQRVVHSGGQGLCYTPQKFGIAKAVYGMRVYYLLFWHQNVTITRKCVGWIDSNGNTAVKDQCSWIKIMLHEVVVRWSSFVNLLFRCLN